MVDIDMRLMNVTFDQTCIIDIEKNNQYADPLRELIRMHERQEINLRVVAISASELKPDHTYSSNFDEFKKRIALIGLEKAVILPALGRWDLTFWNHSVYSGRWLKELENEIHRILFPNETEYSDFCKIHHLKETNKDALKKWVRRKCDVLALWSHIMYNGDIFVTRDKIYSREPNKQKLIRLGARKILEPDQAIKMLDC